MLKTVKNDWVDVKDIIVPVDRYWSKLTEEEKEFIIESIRKLGEKALLSHPILLTKAERSKNMILADGFNRYDAAKKLGLTRVYASIEVYETEEEAVEVAKWKSLGENWIRGQRDPAQLIEKVKNWTSG
ncbi:MAG: ParB N-terminal domain-containing protein, partial [Nitrososphaerota archaeon]